MKLYVKNSLNIDTAEFSDIRVWVNPTEEEIAGSDLIELFVDVGFVYNIDGNPHSSRFRYLVGVDDDTTYPFYESPCLAVDLCNWDLVVEGDVTLENVSEGVSTAVVSKNSPIIQTDVPLSELKLYKGSSWLMESKTSLLLMTVLVSGNDETTHHILHNINVDDSTPLRNTLTLVSSDVITNAYPPHISKPLMKSLQMFDKNGDMINPPKPTLH